MPKWAIWLLAVVVALLAYDRFVKKLNFSLGTTATAATTASTTTATAAKTIDQLAVESIAADNV